MYDLMKAKLLILPEWLHDALQAHEMHPSDIETVDGLKSILSPADVEFYLKQVSALTNALTPGSVMTTVLESLQVLHTNNRSSAPQASGLQEYVKINTLYGKEFAHYDFFNKLNMISYLPRMLSAAMDSKVNVDPYIEVAGTDLFVLRFTTGFYPNDITEDPAIVRLPAKARMFVNNTLNLLMGTYGFDEVCKTKLFDLYCLMPKC